jgi:hypothetical protein
MVFKNINNDVKLFLELRDFIVDINSGEDIQKIIDDIGNIYEKKKTLANIYSELLLSNPTEGVKEIRRYISLTKQLDRIDLTPIDAFLRNDAAEIFVKENITQFIEDILPAIFENNLFNELEEMGLRFILLSTDFDGESIEIVFKNEVIWTPIHNKLIYTLMDSYMDSYMNDYYCHHPEILIRGLDQCLDQYLEVTTAC